MAEITEKQQTVAKATADIANAVRTFSSSRAEAAQQQSKAAEKALEAALQSGDAEAALAAQQQLETARAAAKDWGIGGSKSRALNAVTALTTGILGGQSDLQAAANAVAPYAAAAIGQKYGHGADKNEVAQTVGHFLLGATLAYLNNGDPLTGGSAAVAAEKAAEHLSQQYNDGKIAIDPQTGEFNPNLLPEAVKEEIKATTGAIASIVGATGDGGAALNAQISGVIGQNAVENNSLTVTQGMNYAVRLSNVKNQQERKKLEQQMKKDSAVLTMQSISCRTESECQTVLKKLQSHYTQFNGIASQYETKGGAKEKEWAKFLRQQQKETLADIERVGKKMAYLEEVKGTNQPVIKNHQAKPVNNATFKSSNNRVWNDGRFSSGLDSTIPDYVVVQVGATSVYIPLYGSSSDIYIGGSVSRDHKLKPSYGLSVRFGEIITSDDKELQAMGVYKPSTKYHESTRAKQVHNFLDGVSVSSGACVGVLCVNKVTTVPQGSIPAQHGIEYGLGTGGTSVEIGGGVSKSSIDLINK
ncbi:VENN motif pre-toxin domain-containing protein [Neisseria lisongii]|uniref:VENN motif pre-toxin domain-containing protein n=1 Tax=Neisseria lisongii TaxID=2912188 RepID=A0AAW5AGP6_9NEIS|nr:VENN motif pre-toxin domain-containing protein [Neisseria lisongii]MCF7528806.1 VENN motif pre-toxin domain-containing protein [Neisseria lisongii]MCF7529664.1 VENN motif pre-toxin domain-containing protein [Neisseria lisongii]